MLKVPTAADKAPPLLAPLRRTAPDELPPDGQRRRSKRHHRTRKSGEEHSWENNRDSVSSRQGERKQMRLFLIGGAALLVLIVAGLKVLMDTGPGETSDPLVVSPGLPVEELAKAEGAAMPPRGDAEVLKEAEPLARKFLDATTVDDLLPLVRHPEKTEARMREFYPDGQIEAPGMSAFNASGIVTLLGKFRSIMVTTQDFENRALVFSDSPGDMRIDWEAWVGWSEMPWDEFSATKPEEGMVFRVHVSEVDYYNFDFTDDSKWQSYRLESPDREDALYGYVLKESPLNQGLRPGADIKSTPMMLSLKFPAGAATGDQVEIERIVSEGWVEQGDIP